MVRGLIVLLPALALHAAGPDALAIVRRAANTDDENFRRARNYTFLQRAEEKQFDGKGRLKSTEAKTWDITMLEGSPYQRLIARDDKPLLADEVQKEQRKLEKSIADRRKESESQRTRRIAEAEKRRARERGIMREIPEAFQFQMVGEELLESRPAYVIDCTPRPGYQPRDIRARILPKVKARVWIDKSDYRWVRVHAEVIDSVSFGLFLFRLAKGAKLEIEQTRVNDEVWLPRRVAVAGSARVGLVKQFNAEQQWTFSKFRKFQTDSQMTPVE